MPRAPAFKIACALDFAEPLEFDLPTSGKPDPFQEKVVCGDGVFKVIDQPLDARASACLAQIPFHRPPKPLLGCLVARTPRGKQVAMRTLMMHCLNKFCP